MPEPMPIEFPGPEEPKPPYGRTGHPYFMHDMVRSQSSAVAATIAAAERTARGIPVPSTDRPILFVGMGTSFHAARAAAWAAGPAWAYRQPIRAIDSFDLLLEPELLGRAGAAVVFSSSGETALTLRAQDELKAAGVPQVLISGTATSRSRALADHTILTEQADEKAWVHTVGYTTAVAAALTLLHRWSGGETVRPGPVVRPMEDVVAREAEWRALASFLEDRSDILLLGSGPAEATAREAALKLREGAARFVASAGVEEFLHGILPSVDADHTAVLAVTTAELDRRRASMALHAAERAGAKVVLFGRGRPTEPSHHEFELPSVSLPLTPLVDIIPFQFVTYWLALAAGRNPDVMGFDDPRIFDARRSYGI